MNWRKGVSKDFNLLWEALKKFDQDHGFFLSSGITFGFLICLVPFLLLLLAILGTYLYSDKEILTHLKHYFENAFPSLDPRIMRNILKIIKDRKIVGVLGIGGLIWSATWVFSSLRIALNIIFQTKKGRSILRGKAIDLFMILLAGIFLLISMVLTSGITLLQGYHFGPFINMILVFRLILKYVVPFSFTFLMCFLIFKIVPNQKVFIKPALKAALVTSLFWEVAKHLFNWYILHVGRLSMVYGSLSTLAIFFLWIYYSSAILLFGGEIAFLLGKRKGT